MGIFDSILGDSVSLGDVLSGAGTIAGIVGKVGSSSQNTSARGEDSLFRLQQALNNNSQRLTANPAPGQYAVTKTQAPVSVDPAEEQSRWIARLNQYLNIVPAPVKGAK